jgi:excisionase family DNA binding protein
MPASSPTKTVSAPQSVGARLLTVEEVAQMLRLRPRTIYNLVSRRQIPFRKAGRQLRFAEAEIDEWTKANAAK